MSSEARENILRKLRGGLAAASLPVPFPGADGKQLQAVFMPPAGAPEIAFADAFIALGGRFVFCADEMELLDNIHLLYDSEGWRELLCADLRLLKMLQNNKLSFVQPASPRAIHADACITTCEMLVARTGSVVLSAAQNQGRVASIFHPVHIVVAYASQLVPDIPDALAGMLERYGNKLPSMITLATGASRTADIEKTLVVGVHGPERGLLLFCK